MSKAMPWACNVEACCVGHRNPGNHIGNELGACLEHLENAGIRAYGTRTERGYAFMWVGDRAIAASVRVLTGAGFEFTAFTESDGSNEDIG